MVVAADAHGEEDQSVDDIATKRVEEGAVRTALAMKAGDVSIHAIQHEPTVCKQGADRGSHVVCGG